MTEILVRLLVRSFISALKESAMHFLNQRTAGIFILVLWAMLMVVKGMATGSLLKDRPHGGVWIWLTHVFNFLFLLVATPLAAILLIVRRPEALYPTPLVLGMSGLRTGIGVAGMLLYGTGCILLAWALFTLRQNYQVGGSGPRASDELVTRGPYRFVRHPMYAAALCISLGLACLTQSLAYFCVFCIYVLLIVLLIPFEEEGLRRAYGGRYSAYRDTVKRLAPPFF
jgi:protein-S-isoprenylcysteine O-methyltransferase Ste14